MHTRWECSSPWRVEIGRAFLDRFSGVVHDFDWMRQVFPRLLSSVFTCALLTYYRAVRLFAFWMGTSCSTTLDQMFHARLRNLYALLQQRMGINPFAGAATCWCIPTGLFPTYGKLGQVPYRLVSTRDYHKAKFWGYVCTLLQPQGTPFKYMRLGIQPGFVTGSCWGWMPFTIWSIIFTSRSSFYFPGPYAHGAEDRPWAPFPWEANRIGSKGRFAIQYA